ncbi:hypothetical protein EC9_36110 [Rosistilla ulvae]|uniref:Uncharacterized protein n=2 Tax=Rosistilla ulvae TaxID=1930277 RepID=A0A517M3G3_9BACT|nr:hypothetical protein EC9_36110 [Rosistilla ulvae]
MPIEFPCDGCQQKLRVPDNSAGKQAKCPNCARIQTIPASQTEEPAPAATDPSNDPFGFGGPTGGQPAGDNLGAGGFGGGNFGGAAASHQNPYASPAAASQPMGTGGSGTLSVQPMDPIGAVSIGWELFKRNAGLLIGSVLVIVGVSGGLMLATMALTVAMVDVTGDPNSPVNSVVNIATSLISQLIQLWIGIGAIRLGIAVARGQAVELGMLFSGGPFVLRYIGVSILFTLGMYLGLLLLIVPGIYFSLTYCWCFYFLVDRDCGVMEAFRLSGQHAKGNRLNTFVLGIVSSVLNILGFLMCIAGALVTIPVGMLAMSICYLMMTGQRYWQPHPSGQ